MEPQSNTDLVSYNPEWNKTYREYPGETTLHQQIEEQVNKSPHQVALIFNENSMTYGELNSRANRLARKLRSEGVGPDSLVGLCLERSFEMVIGLLAILKAGGAYVPIDPLLPKARIRYVLADINAPVILTMSSYVDRLLEQEENPVKYILLDSQWGQIEKQDDTDLTCESTEENLAYVIFTSGSTGEPKGVMIPHKGICNRLFWMQEEYGLTSEDRILQKTPFNFDVSVWEFFWPLMTGATLVIAQPEGHKDSAYLVRTIIDNNITLIHFVPSMLQTFLDEPGVETCLSLREVICSGEALPASLQREFFKKMKPRLHNLYGPTEASVDVTFWECQKDDDRLFVPIGRPIANTQIYILDESLEVLSAGKEGELHIGGVGLARGYLNKPELTAEKFIPDHIRGEGMLYKTGDLARWLPDGTIEFLGRNDFQVQIRGFRVELGEIEAALTNHAEIKQALIIVQEEESNPDEKKIIAYLVPQDTEKPNIGELRGFLLERIPDFMIPAVCVYLDEFPVTANGKLDRKALPKPGSLRPEQFTSYTAPRNDLEKKLAEIWQSVLNLDKVGIHDNFFDLGGHSLLMTRIHRLITNESNIEKEVTVVELFQYPTIASLAEHLSSEKKNVSSQEKIKDRAQKQREAMQRFRKK